MKPRVNGLWTRESLVDLPDWDDTLVWYARAVARMRGLGLDQPTGWRYQAAIHGYLPQLDPYFVAGEPLPSQSERTRYWNQCQHFSWFFLPWHRGYLGFFERIVRAHIVAMGGPEEWALPYWDYSDPDPAKDARTLRREFRDDLMPDGAPNPLSDACRGVSLDQCGTDDKAWKQDGNFGIVQANVGLDALDQEDFSHSRGRGISFAGPVTGFFHQATSQDEVDFGSLEATPHGDIHVRIDGWMSAFETAGLDPIFWLHHCNLDRVWEVWLKRPRSRGNSNLPAWLDDEVFHIRDGNGAPTTFTCRQVASTDEGLFSYLYERTDEPLATPEARRVLTSVGLSGLDTIREEPLSDEDRRKVAAAGGPRLLGASEQGVTLRKTEAVGAVRVQQGGPGMLAAAPRRRLLRVENVVGTPRARDYQVYLSRSGGGSRLLVGSMPLFGLMEAGDPRDQHGGGGLNYTFDVTRQYAELMREAGGEAVEVEVAFEPNDPPEGDVEVRVGKISIYGA